jgi:hypothetical protein
MELGIAVTMARKVFQRALPGLLIRDPVQGYQAAFSSLEALLNDSGLTQAADRAHVAGSTVNGCCISVRNSRQYWQIQQSDDGGDG